jgi:outer membrane protein
MQTPLKKPHPRKNWHMRSTRIFLFLITFGAIQITQAQQILTLEEIIQTALQKNYDVRLVQNTLMTAKTDQSYSLGPFLPVITGNANRTFNTNDQKQTLADNSIREGNNIKSNALNANVQLNWTVFDGTKMFATRKRIDEIAALGETNVKNQMMNSIAQVVNNYYNIVRQKQQLIATAELTSFSEERLKLADLKLQVGTGAKPELLQAKLDLNQLRTANLSQETLLIQLKDQLNQLLGMALPDTYEVADTIIIDLTLSREDILSSIETSNQTLIAARKNIDVFTQALHERRGEKFPTIALTSSYTFQRQENKTVINNFSTLENRNIGLNYGVTASLPILNQFNNMRNVSQAKVNLERTNLVYDQQKAVITTSVRNAYTNYDNAKKVLLIEEENILLAKENANIALEGSRRGLYTFIEVRTAQQSLADGYNRLIAARYTAKLAETELLRLKGELVD